MLASWLPSLRYGFKRSQPIPDGLWQQALTNYPFLAHRSASDVMKLRNCAEQFLGQKEFNGAHGLVVTDSMAVAVAAQACLPVLHLGLKLYDDFTGIVVHPGAMLAQRAVIDEAGVHHFYKETLVGEAMQGGPVTLSWQDIVDTRDHAAKGFNVVIHEFAHKLDMRGGTANGCPPLPTRQAKAHWQSTMQAAFEAFKDQVVMAERFGAPAPWLDAYGASSPAEFFAVTTEAYFVNPQEFSVAFDAVKLMFDGYFFNRHTEV